METFPLNAYKEFVEAEMENEQDSPLEFHIKAPQIDADSIFVEQYDDGVWLSIAGLQSRTYTVIPVAQATQLRDALDAILKSMKVAA